MLTTIVSILAVIIAALIAWTYFGSRGERPKYSVLSAAEAIEIRRYAPMIVAEVETPGEREAAISQGFSILAEYIFGNNRARTKIAMTAPVTQQASQTIAMTAPVIGSRSNGNWQVRFMMPSSFDLNSLPEPVNDAIRLTAVPEKTYAVIRFSGIATASQLDGQLQRLVDYLQSAGLEPVSEPVYAFYNPPWTLPPLRRNEIMLEVTVAHP